ncbi:PhzF family phenazine biosynthesis protein [Massilia endophytica]|uniref:PhzF family phenazine biosynthesis protein n=1 Tax=Massilia endophytica TaxID=2899220 RepID=UPI001E297ED2|nr:PhzF family phenazine biosynthesis protein [Massilia endophytica]UGQ45141.1 PhzF family phenazine biosynthesis protein [Massilia endophytica]
METFELKCFGVRAGEGNLALVMLNDTRDEAARQRFAADAGKPATVFVTAGDSEAAYTLDYFYPHTRSPLCLHATLAAGRVLLDRQPGPLIVRTAMRGQLLTLSAQDGRIFIGMARQAAPDVPLPPELPGQLLAQPGVVLASPPAIASVGSPKLLLEVQDSATLQALEPDLPAVLAWGKAHGVSGCYAWCRRSDGSFEGRNFNHLDPALEDAATGVAAGALTVHLGRSVSLYQGARQGQPCRIDTVLEGEHILIGGAAEAA